MAKEIPKPEPAYETHEDGQDPAVRLRLQGCAELSAGILSLDELKSSCKSQAEHGTDPIASGTVELGLFLSEDEYEQLKVYARKLSVSRPKVRRRK